MVDHRYSVAQMNYGGACQEYFQWVEDNPLQAADLVKFQGEAKISMIPKMRAMTMGGLYNFLDIARQTWTDYSTKKDFSTITTRVESLIRQQKLEGAAADMLNPSIIAREIGLADVSKVDHQSSDGSMTPARIERTIIDPCVKDTNSKMVASTPRAEEDKGG